MMSETGGRSAAFSLPPSRPGRSGLGGKDGQAPGTWLEGRGCGEPAAAEEKLNRALVGGLILEVILENPGLLADPQGQRCRVKACLKHTLVSRLAGHIPLATFRNLAQGLDRGFEEFYLLLFPGAPEAAGTREAPREPAGGTEALRVDCFRECLARCPGLLPKRRHRKLNEEKLGQFLAGTGGQWFKLKDFEDFFHIDRKTAWEYVQKLLDASLLIHNQGNSTAVRYRVHPNLLSPAPLDS